MRTLLAVLLSLAAAAAHAQYPQRPVQLIVPWGAGGGTDATARIIGALLEKELKQPFNVVNRTGGSGVVGHQAIAGLLKDQGVDPNALPWVPSNGAAPGLQDMVAGGVEVVPCSIPEARSMIDAGKVKPLAIMDANPSALYPNVPTLKKELGSNWTMAAWRVIAAPKGVPAEVQTRLVATLKKV